MSWLNLQDYLEANAGVADEQATRLDEATFGKPQPQGMALGEYLARKRVASTDEGASALMGGDITDVMLARRGQSQAARPMTFDPQAKARQDAANQQREASYWQEQAKRNQRLSDEAKAARQKQDDSVAASRKAMEERAGGPGYRAYSEAAEKSFSRARGGPRRISEEEWTRWNS